MKKPCVPAELVYNAGMTHLFHLTWMVVVSATAAWAQDVPGFIVRPGYAVSAATGGLNEARFLEIGDDGTLYVSQPRRGAIIALKDTDGDGVYDRQADFITNHPSVHGMDFKDGWLWFTQASDGSAHRARDTDGDGRADDVETILPPGSVPAGGGHPFRAILVGDDAIWISVSDPSNMLPELPSERKTIYRFNIDGSNRTVWSTGIRNTEKLQFRPGTNEIWGMDHGSDWFGREYGDDRNRQPITDLNPPEELNHYVEGGFYGHPFLVGNRIPRPEFANRRDLMDLAERTIPPEWSFPAHWAGNGFTFVAKDYFPDHQGDLFVAFHGSWNRSERGGYNIVRVLFDDQSGKPYGTLTIVSCLSDRGGVLARPVDCVEAPDGTVLFSCDRTNRVYRISRK